RGGRGAQRAERPTGPARPLGRRRRVRPRRAGGARRAHRRGRRPDAGPASGLGPARTARGPRGLTRVLTIGWSLAHPPVRTVSPDGCDPKETAMNRKSAMAIAGGLVAALMSAVGAISASVTGRAPAEAQSAHAARPIVKTITRTITVHRKPKHAAPAPVQVVTVSTGHESEDGHEDDGGEEHGGDD